ncbi:MAG: hypothetical protein MUE73_13450 [Planctomycetes bacterium]|nr:hypothetical protein [Planctomycetota bacterium]
MRSSAAVIVVASCIAGVLLGFLSAPAAPVPAPPPALNTDTAPRGPDPSAPAPRIVLLPEATPPDPAETTGSGRIEGRVTTLAGAPLAGVVIQAFREKRGEPDLFTGDRCDGPPDLDREFAERVAELESEHRFRLATLREAVSGTDGTFALAGLAGGFHHLRASRAGYDFRFDGERRGAALPGDRVEIVAEPVVRLPVSVLDPDGAPARSATLSIEGDRRDHEPWTPDRPAVDLPAGRYRIRASGDADDSESGKVAVEIAEGAAPEPLVLRLEARLAIRGTVLFPAGAVPGDFEARAVPVPGGGGPAPDLLLAGGPSSPVHEGEAGSGYFRIDGFAPGHLLVGILRGRDRVVAIAEVEVRDPFATVTLSVPAEEAGAGLLVTVLAPDGAPLPSVNVQVTLEETGGGVRNSGRSSAVAPGVFRLPLPAPPDALAPGTRGRISATSPRHGTKSVEFDPRAQREVTVRFDEAAFVTVILEGYVEGGYEGDLRLAVTSAPGVQSPFTGAVEPEGRQTFGPLPPGAFWIEAWTVRAMRPLVSRAVTLAGGRQEERIVLPATCRLEVIPDEGDPAAFYLERIGEPPPGAFPIIEGGRAVFRHLPPGEYLLSRHSRPTREHMPVTVTSDRVVRFAPLVPDALLVCVAAPDGVIARAGLLDGDLLIAVDGTEISEEAQGRALLTLAERKEKVTLVVLRGGARRAIEATIDGILDPARAGGDLRPWTR